MQLHFFTSRCKTAAKSYKTAENYKNVDKSLLNNHSNVVMDFWGCLMSWIWSSAAGQRGHVTSTTKFRCFTAYAFLSFLHTIYSIYILRNLHFYKLIHYRFHCLQNPQIKPICQNSEISEKHLYFGSLFTLFERPFV